MDTRHTYVFGHRNPDTDAICAALSYANLLRLRGIEAKAARCGTVNARTEYVLGIANIDPPELINDVRPTVANLSYHKPVVANRNDPFFRIYEIMQRLHLRTVPVVDDHNRFVGLVPLLNLLDMLFPSQSENAESARIVVSSLHSVSEVLGAQITHGIDAHRSQRLTMIVGAMQAAAFRKRLHRRNPSEVVLVCGDRRSIQKPAIEFGVRALIVTGGHELDSDLLTLAKKNNVTVLYTQHDTAMTTLLSKTANIVAPAIDQDCVSFRENTLISAAQSAASERRAQDLFPVVDELGRLVNVFSRGDLVKPPAIKVVMVDHNELEQSVPGIEHAEITEVIDHHRLGGGLRSSTPIRFINDPVGSTNTIIAGEYRRLGIHPDSAMAVCMAAGIIADTLLLSSPTATEQDRELLEWLRPHMPCTPEELAEGFFSTGSALLTLGSDDAVKQDCKTYEENAWRITISQIEELGWDHFWDQSKDLEEALDRLKTEHNADFSCLLITDITKRDSLLLVSGSSAITNGIAYRRDRPNLFKLPDVVSRKKQLLPHLVTVMRLTPPNP